MSNAIEIKALNAKDYVLGDSPKFIDTKNIHKLYDKLLSEADPKSLILHGPKGVSKTLSIQSYAATKGIPLITSECSEDTRRASLTGTFVIENGKTPFVLGDATNAIEVANEVGSAILCFEEINALPPQIQKMINSLTDFRKAINVPECKRIFKLKNGCKLWVVGTMNYSHYGGVYSLNEDFKSRFIFKEIDYPSESEEAFILKSLFPWADAKFIEGITVVAKDLRSGDDIGYKLSTRDLAQWVELNKLLGFTEALNLVSGKFEKHNDKSVFVGRCRSRFKEMK